MRPRLWTRVPATSKIYFEHISRAYPKGPGHRSSTKFTDDFTRMLADPNVFTREISAQVWAVAHIAASKYRWINLAQVFSLVALLS
ncbi:Pycsar system effector family protein, partial [Mycobacterium avium]|uniref:Pycsar system effector family protein n=1 Tax=Mycobacterium avium TaxID=1764 RepID=UPI00350E4118